MLIVSVGRAECYPPLLIVSSLLLLLLLLLCNDVGGGYPAAISEYHDRHDELVV
jgi:hypothetical protein